MSRLKNDAEYKKTRAFRFFRWMKGEKDPYLDNVEIQPGVPFQDSRTVNEILLEEQETLEKVYNTASNRWIWRFRRLYNCRRYALYGGKASHGGDGGQTGQ